MARDDVPLLERERELAVIADGLAAACGGAGGLLTVEGAAGLGKTRLVQAACDSARSRGMTVLSARAGELERGLPFGVVRTLFETPVGRATAADRAVLLEGAAAMAAPVLGLTTGGGTPVRDGAAFTGLHGLYWLTANFAERGPLLVAVDDAHWADEASLRFLVYLVHRLAALPVLVVVAGRREELGADEELLERLRGDPLTSILQPAPLSEPATAAVVRAAFSPRADAEFCRACRTATGGNPLLLQMMSRALRDEGADPTAFGGVRVTELAPQVVAMSVLPRLHRLPGDAGAFARSVAVLGDGVEVRHAAAIAALGIGPATRAADTLASAGILARGRPLEFAHPTVRRAIYQSLPPAELHRAHRHAAELLDADGAPADRVAAHLLVTERLADGWVVAVLRVAAGRMLARGAFEEAVRCLERARQEPPARPIRADVLFELGSAEALTTRIDDACRHLEQAFELAVGVRRRAEIALELARVMSSAARDTAARSRCSIMPSPRWATSTRRCACGSKPSTSAWPAEIRRPEGRRPGGCERWPGSARPAASPAVCCWRTSLPTRSRRRATRTRPRGWHALPCARTTYWNPGSPTSR